MLIANYEIPRIRLVNYDLIDKIHSYHAFETYSKLHFSNLRNDQTEATVKIPFYEIEDEFLNNNVGFGEERNEFIVFAITSKSLYDYISVGINFSKVKKINLCHFSYWNYLNQVDLPMLKELNFDSNALDSYYENEDVRLYSGKYFNLENYVKAIFKGDENKTLNIKYDLKLMKYLDADDVENIKRKYKNRVSFLFY